MKNRELYTIIVFIIIASLDNAALALIPAIIPSIAEGVGVSEEMAGIISFAVAAVTFITAITSFLWGYWGDKYNRKKLLIYGTIIWVIFIFLTAFARNFTQLIICQLLSGVGLGCIASVGFSIVTDFISPRRRSFFFSLWGLSQGLGSAMGYTLAVICNVQFGWNSAFLILSGIAAGFIVAYFFTVEPERGATEEELQDFFKSNMSYEYRIRWDDLRYILRIQTNKYLILQGFFAQITWGGLTLLPTVFILKLLANGVSEGPASVIGPFIASAFQIGIIFSIFWGKQSDKYQRKSLKARALISAAGYIISLPLLVAMVLVPIQFAEVPNTDNLLTIIGYIFTNFFTNPLFLLVFLLALSAAFFVSAEIGNFHALIGDVNLPEHRGTMFGFSHFISGIGRSTGLVLLPGMQLLLYSFLIGITLEMSWILAFIIILLFLIPTGICYILAARTTPNDIMKVKEILSIRAKKAQ